MRRVTELNISSLSSPPLEVWYRPNLIQVMVRRKGSRYVVYGWSTMWNKTDDIGGVSLPSSARRVKPHGWRRVRRMLVRLSIAFGLFLLVYVVAIRPWHLRWGATDEEVVRALPGDSDVPDADLSATHAVGIDASAAEVWPWLVQIGQGRGGLYSYDWLENLLGCDIHSVDRVIPELGGLRVGDTIRLGPPGYPFNIVGAIKPERSLLLYGSLASPEGENPTVGREAPFASTWAFVLVPVDSDHTRLIVRFRASWSSGIMTYIGYRGFLEPAHFIMERKMLLGIKERAERGYETAE